MKVTLFMVVEKTFVCLARDSKFKATVAPDEAGTRSISRICNLARQKRLIVVVCTFSPLVADCMLHSCETAHWHSIIH